LLHCVSLLLAPSGGSWQWSTTPAMEAKRAVGGRARHLRLNWAEILKVVTDARAGCARLRRKCGATAVGAASDALRNSLSRLLKKSEKFVRAGI
jgi:hypothetical protein